MRRDFAEIEAKFDFILDQFNSGEHLEDVRETAGFYAEDFMAAGCDPQQVAMMMDPEEVIIRSDIFGDIDINSIAKQMDYINLENYLDKLVELGVQADSIRETVAEWDGKTIVENSVKLQKCGFSKEELADLLYRDIHQFKIYFDFDESCLGLISASSHLYDFLRQVEYEYDFDGTKPFSFSVLIEHGADKEIIVDWIIHRLAYRLFDDEEFQREMDRCGIVLSEDQIVEALEEDYYVVEDLLGEKPNKNFLKFLNDSKRSYELISKLDEVSCHALLRFYWDEIENFLSNDRIIQEYPELCKNLGILCLEEYDEEPYNEEALAELDITIDIFKTLQLSEDEWKRILFGKKRWLEEYVKVASSDPERYLFDEKERRFYENLIALAS